MSPNPTVDRVVRAQYTDAVYFVVVSDVRYVLFSSARGTYHIPRQFIVPGH